MTEEEAEAFAARLKWVCDITEPEVSYMTRQEVGSWAARLIKIWGLKEEGLAFHTESCYFSGQLQGGVEFSCYISVSTEQKYPYNVAIHGEGAEGFATLYHSHSDGVIYDHYQSCRVDKDFVQQWLPTFRRNCWLSGVNIEASAHEKAEWMQELSREEIEAWNLKM